MATEHIQVLADEFPSLFENLPIPENWEEEYIIFSAESPTEDPLELGAFLDSPASFVQNETVSPALPIFSQSSFPGAPARSKGGAPPPPDALAFYLPYHYFYPVWWGVYITVEGIILLAQELTRYGVSSWEATRAARLFLYGHESFHHRTEVFATRLELTHRRPLYRTSISVCPSSRATVYGEIGSPQSSVCSRAAQ